MYICLRIFIENALDPANSFEDMSTFCKNFITLLKLKKRLYRNGVLTVD